METRTMTYSKGLIQLIFGRKHDLIYTHSKLTT
jgi:hypothetical protein